MIESSNLKKSALLTLLLMATQVAMLRAAPVSWVERSNANSIVLLKAIASTKPEEVSSYGLKDYDNQVADLVDQGRIRHYRPIFGLSETGWVIYRPNGS